MDSAAQEFARKIIAILEHIRHLLTNAPGEQNEQTIPEKNKAHEEQAKVKPCAPALAQRNPSIIQTEKPHPNWRKPFEWWKTRVEVVALTAGVGYAIVTYLQWQDLRHNFEVDQRAWVSVASVSAEELEEKEGEYSFKDLWVSIRNSGKTPALSLKVEDLKIAMRSANDPVPDYETAEQGPPGKTSVVNVVKSMRNGVLAPNAEMKLSFLPRVQRLTFKGHPIYFLGKITYRDIFQNRHTTRFCIMHTEKGGFGSCPDGNSVD